MFISGTRLRNPLTVSGWGVTEDGSNNLADILLEVKVIAVTQEKCAAALQPYQVHLLLYITFVISNSSFLILISCSLIIYNLCYFKL